MINRVFYLGPIGSYSELAKNSLINYFLKDYESVPLDSIHSIVNSLISSQAEGVAAIIPIENSVEGTVTEAQDCLIKLVRKGFRIHAEVKLAIEHSLISYGDKSQIVTVKSHPQALAQCREYLFKSFGDNVNFLPTLSTSEAVSSLSKNEPDIAAIGSFYSAKIYNVPVLDRNINDEENNTTRFVLISKLQPKKTSLNKISITFSTENKAGALNKVLAILEKYDLNMSYINSRPSRKELGEYVFYVDFSGHIEDNAVLLALTEIQNSVDYFELLSEGAVCIEM